MRGNALCGGTHQLRAELQQTLSQVSGLVRYQLSDIAIKKHALHVFMHCFGYFRSQDDSNLPLPQLRNGRTTYEVTALSILLP